MGSPSIWQKKPWWCQPWSIILTGIIIPSTVWLLTHLWWLTLPVVMGILVWWYVFLYLVPKSYTEQTTSDQ
ncbi:DUF6737 family protein [Dactylococcopsis salina]|uniref:DUF6737 domain-containing protein n=1 Tax=Dactylococcopsis salina (strain PCC 8305) TaxID=13035 RepID=K9YX78_DACS8|nr:DUF6737 family protein [Dactylococcopsis salina]AFZ51117.1 hypothetical protein Dacsa_2527 [Dactylococcopsis salina PCC 8305]